MYTCYVCSKQFERRTSVVRHASIAHDISPVEFTIATEFNGVRPLCECGCGEEVGWKKGRPNRFVHSHASRVLEIRQAMIDAGRQTAADEEKRKKNSDSLRKLWQDEDYREAALKRLEHARKFSVGPLNELRVTQEYRDYMSRVKKDFWASEKGIKLREFMKTKEFHDLVSEPTKAGLSRPEVRRALSESSSRLVELGIIGGSKNTMREWIEDPLTLEQIYVHSSWEKAFVEVMFKKGEPVVRNHGLRIDYIDECGAARLYTPDFTSLDGNIVYEIKGRMTLRDEFKFNAAEKWCSSQGKVFVVIVEKPQ